MTKNYGSFIAAMGGLLNEKKGDFNPFKSQDIQDRKMDDKNNACGIYAGGHEESCSESCERMLENGTLETKMGDGENPYWNGVIMEIPNTIDEMRAK